MRDIKYQYSGKREAFVVVRMCGVESERVRQSLQKRLNVKINGEEKNERMKIKHE